MGFGDPKVWLRWESSPEGQKHAVSVAVSFEPNWWWLGGSSRVLQLMSGDVSKLHSSSGFTWFQLVQHHFLPWQCSGTWKVDDMTTGGYLANSWATHVCPNPILTLKLGKQGVWIWFGQPQKWWFNIIWYECNVIWYENPLSKCNFLAAQTADDWPQHQYKPWHALHAWRELHSSSPQQCFTSCKNLVSTTGLIKIISCIRSKDLGS